MTRVVPEPEGRHRQALRPLLSVALAVFWSLAASGCAPALPDDAFANAAPTKEAAVETLLDALAAADLDRLKGLAVSEAEFRTYVWPELPASDPDVGMPLDYLWADVSTKSLGYLGQLLERHGGQRLTLEKVYFAGAATAYGPFTVHAETHVRVRDGTGAGRDLRLFGSMLEWEGGWKLYSYVVD